MDLLPVITTHVRNAALKQVSNVGIGQWKYFPRLMAARV